MDKERWQQVEQIVDGALCLSEEKRDEYILEQCSGDQNLQDTVFSFLNTIEASRGFMESAEELQSDLLSAFSREYNGPGDGSALIGEVIGAYKITELLGHGGMGSVFLTKRIDGNFDHRVALKLVRRGMDTPENIARFKRERSILANLNHPNIARMYDGGITKDGLPYLIMEYVDGKPIDTYCREHELSLEQRLELFKEVCHAVQYAHENLIIHRDLKPANILVNTNGTVKILDFGVAKLLENDQNGNETVFATGAGSKILTLAHAAPEQLTTQQVTTATDNYALGILLHQLLAETHPFDFNDKGLKEIEKIIKHRSPSKPSNRTKKWTKKLEGDLDAIILKALRKQPAMRYNSAGELLEDLKRYKKELPVLAHDDTFQYNVSKFIKRHKPILSVAALILFIVLGFGLFYTYQIAKERNQAHLQAEKAQQVSNFMIELFEANAPDQAQGSNLPVSTILKEGEQNLEQLEQPEVKATMYAVIGNIYRKLGEPKKAMPLLTESRDIANRIYPGPTPEKADIYTNLGLIKDEVGNYTEAESLYINADKIYRQGLNAPSKEQAINLSNLAELYIDLSEFEKAKQKQLEALEILNTISNSPEGLKAHSFNLLGLIYKRLGKNNKAKKYYHRALSSRRLNHTEPHPRIAVQLHNLGVLYYDEGIYDSARVYLEQALDQRVELFGKQHPLVASTYNGLGLVDNITDNYDRAALFFTEGLSILQNHYGESHLRVALNMMNLAVALKNKGSVDQAIKYLEKAKSIIQNELGHENFYAAVVDQNLGQAFLKAQKHALSEKAFNYSLDLYKTISPGHQRMGAAYTGLAKLYLEQYDYEPAESNARNALEIYTSKFDNTSQRLGKGELLLGKILFHQQKLEQAKLHLKTAKSILSGNTESPKMVVAEADSLIQQINLKQ